MLRHRRHIGARRDALISAPPRGSAQGAEAIVLAGAVLCGYDAALQAELGLPVYDGVSCAVRQSSRR